MLKNRHVSGLRPFGPGAKSDRTPKRPYQCSSTRLRSKATEIVEHIGPPAAPAVDALEANLSHGYHEIRVAAARALWRITGRAEPWLEVLMPFLGMEHLPITEGGSFGSSTRDRVKVIEFLGTRGPAARAALPGLRKLTRHESRDLRTAAKEAIERITRAESKKVGSLRLKSVSM